MRYFLFLLIAGTLISACSSQEQSETEFNPQNFDNTVILISFDGLRSDYIDWYDTPNLDRLIAGGAHANEGMKPVYPSKTFPNHYSIVTGLYPANHGIVSNSMYDSELDENFSIGNRDAVTDARWWGGEPIWVSAENQNVKSGTYFWVGSEAPINGVYPSYWYEYDGSVSQTARVDQALEWLDMPVDERPGFISLYFSDTDNAGHGFGPQADETSAAVTLVDSYLGRLIEGLESRGLYDHVNIIIVADHGMAQLSPDRVIALDEYIDLDDVFFIDGTPLVGLHPVDGKEDAVFNALENAHPNLFVYRRDNGPERFMYEGNHRIPPIFGHADDGWSIARTREFADQNPDRYTGGTHGYDNEAASMRATFIAHGPAFKDGVTIEPFLNIEIYNVMAEILGITPAENDGTAGSLASILN